MLASKLLGTANEESKAHCNPQRQDTPEAVTAQVALAENADKTDADAGGDEAGDEGGGDGDGVGEQKGSTGEVRIVAVDLQPMAPIEGVKQLQVRRSTLGKSHGNVRRIEHGYLAWRRTFSTVTTE